jgi:hypothetical protein
VWGEPDEDRWLTVQVAALHGYLFDLSAPDALDQADELSALIPAIVAQLHQDGDTVPALETADWLPPFNSVALVGATVNLLDRAASLLCERLAYALADHLPLVEADDAEPPALEHPQHWWLARGWHPSITASWSEPATHQQPAPRHGRHPNSGTPFTSRCCHRAVSWRNTTRRSPTSGQAAGSIAHDVHAIAAEETAVEPTQRGARLRNTRGYRSYSARVGDG